MKLEKIISYLEREFPKKNAEEWDNIGLMIGDRESDIKKILIALDLDNSTLEIAIRDKIDLIITHHPFIFSGVKSIDFGTLLGKKIEKIIKNGINVYSMHTNIDSTKGGLNDYILEKLGVEESKVLDPIKGDISKENGIGRYFKIEESTIKEYINFVKSSLEIERVTVYSADINNKTKKVALINGGGATFWKKAEFYGVNLIFTGDIKYHDAQEAVEKGLTLVDLGHYQSEKFFMELVEKKIREVYSDQECSIDKIVYPLTEIIM